jgi:hypothetical protein
MTVADLSATNSRVVSVRLPDRLYNHLVVQASRAEVSIAEAARQALERDVAAQPDFQIEGNAPGDPGLSYRTILDSANVDELLNELLKRGDATP